jgi:HEAT repeat protein
LGSYDRLNTINYLLDTALDSEEEYVYEGEMSYYMRTYAGDAADELSWLFRGSAPTEAELDLCVKALSDPHRMERGRSKELLLRLRERSRPILDALGSSPDPQLRIFALETGAISLNPYFHDPLYGTIELEQRLLDDPDEDVRVAALSPAQQTIVHNAAYLKHTLEIGASNPMLELLSRILARLGDPSPRVRTAAANVVLRWADEFGKGTLEMFLEREHNAGAREALARATAQREVGTRDEGPALNASEDEG